MVSLGRHKMNPAPNSSPSPPDQSDDRLVLLTQCLSSVPELEFAVLVGSRARGTAQGNSDWDIALQWQAHNDWLSLLGAEETLRRHIANNLGVPATDIDLIDLARANLAMRASAAEEGLVLKGEATLAWAHFLNRTWRELEDYYWEQAHAA